MQFKFILYPVAVVAASLLLAGCEINTPSISDIRSSKLFDRRIQETPRQKVIRECQQEADRFRVGCVYCHATDKVEDIAGPDKLQLTHSGERAAIMRTSPSFGLNKDCTQCHQSKFKLTRSAEKMFGPAGTKQ